MAEQLDALRRQMGRQGGRLRLPDKIHVDLPTKVDADFAHAFDVRLVEQTTAPWEFWFGLLEQFVEQPRSRPRSGAYTVDDYQLGGWVNAQRDKHAKAPLTPTVNVD